jgi:hypothetical protein
VELSGAGVAASVASSASALAGNEKTKNTEISRFIIRLFIIRLLLFNKSEIFIYWYLHELFPGRGSYNLRAPVSIFELNWFD